MMWTHRVLPLFLVLFFCGCDQFVTQRNGMVHVGQQAPDFSCLAAVAPDQEKTLTLSSLGQTYKVIFFYPADFTYVCPTELHAFQDRYDEFKKRNAVVVGVSVDDIATHKKWLTTPKEQGGVQGITYPLIADSTKSMCKAYGVLDAKHDKALRGLFILDKANNVHVVLIQNMSVGRNIDEVLRLIDAIQFTESHGAVCPAQWALGKEALEPTHEGVVDYFKHQKDKQ